MLNQHENLLVPKSDHLRVGDCVVDIARREVTAPGAEAPRRITVKAVQVLLVLVAHHGKVISREALLEWVWSGTFPGDDVLTQAVTQLRKAFGDERDAPRYLETIAKGGYRLRADVAWLPTQRASEGPMTGAATPPASTAVATDKLAAVQTSSAVQPRPDGSRSARSTFLLAALAGLALLVALAGLIWRGVQVPSPSVAPSATGQSAPQAAVRTLAISVVASRLLQESRPSLSPDGSLIAFVVGAADGERAIHVQANAAVAPTRLSKPPAGYRDDAPRWSPDGRQIMFIRMPNDDNTCEFQLVPASGGTPRPVGSCSGIYNAMYEWMPGGRALIAGGGSLENGDGGARLRVLDLDSGVWRAFPYQAKPGDVDFDPRPSPDGRWLVFRRNISNSDFWRVPITGGAPERLTHLQGNIAGWDWTPDSKALVFAYLRSEYTLQRYDIADKRMTVLDIGARRPDIAARAAVMAFEIIEQQTGLFRQTVPGQAHGVASRALFPSSGSDLLPSVSPDGDRIAFYSDRTRETRVWIGAADGEGAPTVVEGIVPFARHPPRWMDDGKTVLVIGYRPEETVNSTLSGVFAIDVRSGRVRRLEIPRGLNPIGVSPLPGRRVLMVVDTGEGRLSMRVFDTTGGAWRELAGRDNVGEARYDATGDSIWYVRTDQSGLWRTTPDLKAQIRVDAERPAVYWMRTWLLFAGAPYLTLGAEDCPMAWKPLMSKDQPGVCLERTPHYADGEPTLSGDRRWLYYSAALQPENTDIGTVRLD